MKYIKQPEYTEKGVRHMMCQCGHEYIRVGEEATSTKCYYEIHSTLLTMFPETIKPKKSGRPPGWHFMSEFVDKDGTVFHKGE